LKHAGVKTAVIGATGYSGYELARILLRHPKVAPPLFLQREGGHATALDATFPGLYKTTNGHDLKLHPFSWEMLTEHKIELLFLATPHEQSREWVPEAVNRGIRVIDLSGAWRLHVPANRKPYGFPDNEGPQVEEIQKIAVYGLPELHRLDIAKAKVIANPGCYATSIILALSPLLRANLVDRSAGIVCDAKSGVSGAGKQPTPKTHFVQVADNLSAYGAFDHRHGGELLEQLGLKDGEITFVPHLLPIPRGILSTVYLRLSEESSEAAIHKLFEEFYASSPVVRVYPPPAFPQIQYCVNTSFCDIGFKLASDKKRLVVVSCLDNLLKGAASQAVQNMNVMYGWPEQEGLQ